MRRYTGDRQSSRKYPFSEYILLTNGGETECYEEAVTDDHKEEWLKSMQEEIKSLHENHTYDLVKLPTGKRALKNKWVYRLKAKDKVSQPRYKARLLVKGFG